MEDHTGETRNRLSGTAHNSAQAGSIYGGVHFNSVDEHHLPPQQLPPDIAHFTGRQSDLRALDHMLARNDDHSGETVVITALAGTPGVGKTALAIHWAHRIKDRFPDGVLYANLHGYDPHRPADPKNVLDNFINSLDGGKSKVPKDLDGKMAHYRSLLARRRVLVVLDNASTPGQVRPLIPASPTCLVLVTSRSRLSGLAVHDGARSVALGLMSPQDAVALLTHVVGPRRIAAEPQAARQLSRLCDYLPLALRIAAQRVLSDPVMTLAGLVDDLSVERHRLDGLDLDDDETAAVRPVFSWSYNALTDDLKTTFRLLGLHDNPDIEIETTATLVDITRTAARQHLNSLVNVHLIENYGERYRFHDLLRVYANERARTEETDESRAKATRRLSAWREHVEHRKTAALIESLGDSWGSAAQFRSTAEAVLQRRWSGDAVSCFENALANARRSGDVRLIGRCAYGLGIAHAQLGDEAKSARYRSMAADEFRKIDDESGFSACQGDLDGLA